MKQILIFFVLLATPMAVLSQDSYEGFKKAGNALFGGTQDEAYRQGVEQALRREITRQQLIEAQQDGKISEIETAARARIANFWVVTGLSEEEAASVSSEFRLQNRQISINARAQRDGIEKTLVRALRAYSDYDYLLANQLLIAAERISGATPEQLSSAQKAVEAEKERIGIELRNP